MRSTDILELLRRFERGESTLEGTADALGELMYHDLGYAKVDNLRKKHKGFAEVVYCASKTPEQTAGIVTAMLNAGEKNILLTRASADVHAAVAPLAPCDYNEIARTIVVAPERTAPTGGVIVVACAGTSDLPVAEEAAVTAEVMGNRVERLFDVGVAGIHRVLMNARVLRDASVVIAVAGMEGALPSVIGGLTQSPIIAVPTSVGYGANFGGLSALLTMLNSCASGVSVVNIDNGFGAGYQAALINNLTRKRHEDPLP